MTVANTTEWRISVLARYTTSSIGSRSPSGRRRILAQPAHDVLDVDDRIVHQLADGDGEAAEAHAVDA